MEQSYRKIVIIFIMCVHAYMQVSKRVCCVCVRACVHLYEFVHACKCERERERESVCVCVCVYMRACVQACVYMSVCE